MAVDLAQRVKDAQNLKDAQAKYEEAKNLSFPAQLLEAANELLKYAADYFGMKIPLTTTDPDPIIAQADKYSTVDARAKASNNEDSINDPEVRKLLELPPLPKSTPPCAIVHPPYSKWVYTGLDGDQYSDSGEKTEGEFQLKFYPPVDPLIVDLNGNGIETVGLNASIQFDHNGSGVKQGTGWVAPSDGLLALDRNGNGVIDNGTELFGNNTPLYDAMGNITGYAADGQAALASLDSNHDGVVNNLDANFANLKVWQDLNQDGVSQSNELITLADAGIISLNVGMISTDSIVGFTQPQNGNQLTSTGTFTRTDGTTGTTSKLSR